VCKCSLPKGCVTSRKGSLSEQLLGYTERL
jgi:hypothetical protein